MDTPTVTLRTCNGRLALHISRMLLLNGETQKDSCENANQVGNHRWKTWRNSLNGRPEWTRTIDLIRVKDAL